MQKKVDVKKLEEKHDAEFVSLAYREILGRDVDTSGFEHYLQLLRSGKMRKFDIITRLRMSPEGRSYGAKLTPFGLNAVLSLVRQTPVVGWICFVFLDLLRLPFMLQPVQAEVADLRRIQALQSAQRIRNNEIEEIGEYIYGLDCRTLRIINSIDNSIEIFSTLNKKIENIEASQVSLEGRIEGIVAELGSKAGKNLAREIEMLQKKIVELQDEWLELRKIDFLHKAELMQKSVRKIEDDITDLRKELLCNVTKFRSVCDNFHKDIEFTRAPIYAAFEDTFRGPESLIYDRANCYLPLVKEVHANLGDDHVHLDLGSGRGEWLRFLTDKGYKAVGVESNPVFVERSRSYGLQVHSADIIDFLREQSQGMYCMVSAFHIAEHLSPSLLLQLLEQCHRVLMPGGLLILETPNPMNIYVSSFAFNFDLTHRMPLVPDTLEFFLKASSFGCVRSYFMSDDGRQRNLTPKQDFSFVDIQSYLEVSGDYAVVAKKI